MNQELLPPTVKDGEHVDVLVIGGGPAGQNAAIQAARSGKLALVVEREISIGGSCVQRGTIPSKTLRETAMALSGFKARSGGVFTVTAREDLQVASLMTRLEQVITGNQGAMAAQLSRAGVARTHGRARFIDAHTVEIRGVNRSLWRVTADIIVIATGSRPRTPPEIPIDHQHLLDSDSILSMTYLPRTLTVLGAGVIAAEYASIFASLGVQVTMLDKSDRPVSFLDPELTDRFVASFTATGSRWLPKTSAKSAVYNGVGEVVTQLSNGETLHSEKLLCALGRIANLDGLDVQSAGITPTDRGLLAVDANYRTTVDNVYAVGDVIGPPSLASCSMDQGRRAVCHALGQDVGVPTELIPLGIYTIPEMSSIGLSEAEARKRYGDCMVARASFGESARGQIAAIPDGLLKLIVHPDGHQLLGVQVVGENAAELVSIGQMALLHHDDVDLFVNHTFNFPTLTELYRMAALEIQYQRREAAAAVGAG